MGLINEWKNLEKIKKLTDKGCSIVFYAENKASMNHFRLLLLELTEIKNLQICYVTSIKDDSVFSLKNKNIFAFHIGEGVVRTKFFLTLKAKILIMDMPDLQTFHIKRSKVYPVHYIYIFHSMFSIHSYLRKGAIDNYDTIFCVGEYHEKEIRETEKKYQLKPKKLIKYGFGRLDTLLDEKEKFQQTNKENEKLIIISPSYGKDNLLNICGIELIEILLKMNFKVLLRPHFLILKNSNQLIKKIQLQFKNNPNFIFEKGIIPSNKFHNSVCMISDWSGISLEYAFTFERPVIFIDVPKKILNQNSEDISSEPIEISIRKKIGFVVSPNNLEEIPEIIEKIFKNNPLKEQIKKIRSETVYNVGKSAIVGADIIEKIYNDLT
ncbi:CDP-glycerol glycerophosphotransferase family protein [Nitrosopumilus sp.]|nr:CDP-glycerol glycerophosphotransferase family protein [Nitrosopumilus sp.]